jgi:Reverse transcriptase (RNA-dependent DNA polymerase)
MIDVSDDEDDSINFLLDNRTYLDLASIATTFNEGFECLHINVRSIKANFDKLKDLLNHLSFKPKLILLTEVWLRENEIETIHLTGYNFEFKVRENSKYGGCGLFITEELSYSRLSEVEKLLPECENLAISVKVTSMDFSKTDHVTISCIYRAPRMNYYRFCQAVENYINELKKYGPIMCMGGDMNIDFLKSEQNYLFFDVVTAAGLRGVIETPTRPDSGTCIDLLLTGYTGTKGTTAGTLVCDISDHLPVFVIFHSKLHIRKGKSTREITDFEAVLQQLSEVSDGVVREMLIEEGGDSVALEGACDFLLDKCSMIIKSNTKTVKVNKKNTNIAPWFTDALRRSYKKKLWLYKQMCKHPNEEIWKSRWKIYANKYKRLTTVAKRLYYDKFFKNEQRLREKWKTLKESVRLQKVRKKTSVKKIRRENDNEIITDTRGIAKSFNEYFAAIGQKLSDEIPLTKRSPLFGLPDIKNVFAFESVTCETIGKVIAGLDSKDSTDVFGMSNNFVKRFSSKFKVWITDIFNAIVSLHHFPRALKTAKVVPLYKSGKHEECSNYRPISLIPIVAKVVEKCLKVQLYKYFVDNNLLAKSQFGFREGHSTEDAVMTLYDQLCNHLNYGRYACGIFIDLSKAFDTVNHGILLQKLKRYGLTIDSCKLLKSYLNNRRQRVVLNDDLSQKQILSEEVLVNVGSPQGTCLSPLLFAILVNDMIKAIPNIVQFADDTAIIGGDKNLRTLQVRMNNTLLILSEWLKANKLSLNAKKTHYILFKPAQKQEGPFQLIVNRYQLDRVPYVKYLGVYIDECLNWRKHVEIVRGKISNFIPLLYRCKLFHNVKIRRLIYITFVKPYLIYALAAYGNAAKSVLKPLHSKNNKLIRLIAGVNNHRISAKSFYTQLKLLPLGSLFLQRLALLSIRFFISPELEDREKFKHNPNFRVNEIGRVFIRKPLNKYGEKCFSFRCSKLLNRIPEEVWSKIEIKRPFKVSYVVKVSISHLILNGVITRETISMPREN